MDDSTSIKGPDGFYCCGLVSYPKDNGHIQCPKCQRWYTREPGGKVSPVRIPPKRLER